MRAKIGTMLATGVAALLIAGGCGSDDDESDTLSHEELVTEANDICQAQNDRAAQIQAQLEGKDPFAAESADEVDELTAQTLETVDRLAALEPPDEDAPTYGEYIDLLQTNSARLADLSSAVREGDGASAREIQAELDETSDETQDLTTTLGLDSCAP